MFNHLHRSSAASRSCHVPCRRRRTRNRIHRLPLGESWKLMTPLKLRMSATPNFRPTENWWRIPSRPAISKRIAQKTHLDDGDRRRRAHPHVSPSGFLPDADIQPRWEETLFPLRTQRWQDSNVVPRSGPRRRGAASYQPRTRRPRDQLLPRRKKLLLVLKDPDPDSENVEKNSHKKWPKGKPWVIDRLQFKEDYTGYLDHRRNHIYVYDLESKKLVQVTSGDYDDSNGVWLGALSM